MIKIRRGLDIPLAGAPEQTIARELSPRHVALVGADYVGMKPTMAVAEGDTVAKGDTIFTDKKCEGVVYTAPASGRVSAINRGARRVFQSLVIEVDDGVAARNWGASSVDEVTQLSADDIKVRLIESGEWTAIRVRPFSKVADPATSPSGLFITAIDTRPHAVDPEIVIAEQREAFELGQSLLANMVDCSVYVCVIPGSNAPLAAHARVQSAVFDGPHPAGLVGTHVHFLQGASLNKLAWTVDYQDVIAVGRLFLDGEVYSDRVVSVSGPAAETPQIVRTRRGADIEALVAGNQAAGENRLISGSVLGGRRVQAHSAYLGRFHNQVAVLAEGRDRIFMGWLAPGTKKHSAMGIYLSSLFGRKPLEMTTTTNGSERAMVPVGAYERIMPLDILPTQLLRALLVGDTETAQALGCLELDEEDLALCTYVCPGKYEYGPVLRDNLARIEKEG
tara:strand:+ start:1622 stop:2968 length:1347 start_codon:yes stop_codon:yes gene_type:complete